jgi:hypothetical protein
MSFPLFRESQEKFAEHELCGGRASLGQENRQFVTAEATLEAPASYVPPLSDIY